MSCKSTCYLVLINHKLFFRFLSSGIGETDVSNFGRALLAYKFYNATEQLKSHEALEALKQIHLGYQSILKMRSKNGSFSMWDDGSESVWFNAYIIQLLSEARDVIKIDEKLIKGAITFLDNKQNKTDGSFDDLSTGYRNVAPVAKKNYLTAFSLLALLKSNKTHPMVKEALNFVANATLYKCDNRDYDKAIGAYVLSLGNRQRENTSDFKLEYNYMNLTSTNLRNVEQESVFIEVASLDALRNLHENNLVGAANAIKWLITRRNKDGQFPSAFDSRVGLEAIVEYMSRVNIKKDDHVTVDVHTKNTTIFTLNVESSTQIIHEDLRNVTAWTDLRLDFEGRGLIYANVWFQYMIDEEIKNGNNFHITMHKNSEATITFTLNCIKIRCNMGLTAMEVTLPSGYAYVSHVKSLAVKVSN